MDARRLGAQRGLEIIQVTSLTSAAPQINDVATRATRRVTALRITLAPGATAPTRGTPGSAGLDLCALEGVALRDSPTMVRTGVSVEIPEGWVGLVAVRSSVGRRGIVLSNSVAVIDADYRGEILLSLRATRYGEIVGIGERIAQLVIVPCFTGGVEVVDALSPTVRADGGFGSTGR